MIITPQCLFWNHSLVPCYTGHTLAMLEYYLLIIKLIKLITLKPGLPMRVCCLSVSLGATYFSLFVPGFNSCFLCFLSCFLFALSLSSIFVVKHFVTLVLESHTYKIITLMIQLHLHHPLKFYLFIYFVVLVWLVPCMSISILLTV